VVIAGLHVVTLDYFRALRIPLKQGRIFSRNDRDGAPRIMVVNETAARALFPGEDPVGKLVGCCELDAGRLKMIVGVVGDTRSLGPAAEARPEFFLPVQQAPRDAWGWFGRSMTVVVRGRNGDPALLAPVVRDAMRRVDAAVPLYNVRTMEERLQRSVAPARFNTLLMLLLGSVGLVLAAVGIYGVLSYLVTERQREIGIRMALGATGSHVVRMVVRQGMQPVALGIAVGLAAALAVSRVLSTYVTGVTTTDPLTFAAVVALMIVVALIASAVPAWRAVRTDPTRVLHRA
jgi:putative ABC transport system permease protein